MCGWAVMPTSPLIVSMRMAKALDAAGLVVEFEEAAGAFAVAGDDGRLHLLVGTPVGDDGSWAATRRAYSASTCPLYSATEAVLSVWRMAAKPPTDASPMGTSMNESTMIRNPWMKSV